MTHRPIICINTDFVPGKYKRYTLPVNYYHAVLEHGGLPLISPALPDEAVLRKIAEEADGFLFIGGDDYPPELYGEPPHPTTEPGQPERAQADLMLAKIVLEGKKPALGICVGHQLMQIATGGKLIQNLETDLEHRFENYHDISIEANSQLAAILGSTQAAVNSFHHQAINPDTLDRSRFRITASAPDGTVEAMESITDPWILSLQYHPERIKDSEHRRKIFTEFIRQAAAAGEQR